MPIPFKRSLRKVSPLLTCIPLLLSACSARQEEETTPFARQQLDRVQSDLDAAAQSAAERLQTACDEQNANC